MKRIGYGAGLVGADHVRSTLKRPPQQLIDRFHVGQVGDDTIRTFLENGWSLAICCHDCPRMIE